MKIFEKKLTNRSILTLQTIMEAVEIKHETMDIIVACKQAKLIQYASKEGMSERFGTRMKKSVELSLLFQIINGLARENEELRKKLAL